MNETEKATVRSLMSRFDELPGSKKALFGKQIIAYAMAGDQLRQALPNVPQDPLVPAIENFILALELR